MDLRVLLLDRQDRSFPRNPGVIRADERGHRRRAISRVRNVEVRAMPKKTNKSTRLERNQAISNGLRSLPSKTVIPMNGEFVKASDAAEVFEIATEAQKEVGAARAKYSHAVAAARAAEAKVKTLIPPIKSFVQNAFGERSDTAASFGFEPRKRRYVSVDVRYEAVEKLRATRAARDMLDDTHGTSLNAASN